MALITEAAPDDVDSASTPSTARSGPPRWVVVTIVVLVAASGGVWWSKRQPDPLRLGDRGHVTARVDEVCDSLNINAGRLVLRGDFHPRGDHSGRPRSWRHGDHIEGTLHIDQKTGPYSLRGTFTAVDGTKVIVGGGIEGKIFFTMDCYISG